MAEGRKIRPRFTVKKLEGEVEVRVCVPKAKGGLEWKTVKRPAGWMVSTSRGASIRVGSEREMKRLGFDLPPDLVDIESGDIVDREAA